jgi:GH25 family lysozyme M1 (1,4-beta-N-acetylmuramidase)/fibronectin type 3 domain-containing protein
VKFTGRKKWGAGLILAALLCLLAPHAVYAATDTEEYDGVLGQSIREEAESLDSAISENLSRVSAPSILGSGYSTSFLDNSFTTTGKYSSGYSTYYHNIAYKNRTLVQGIDVSYWQSKGQSNASTRKVSALDWKKIKNAGIDFAFVRIARRGLSSSGALAEDDCADSHIQGAMDNNIDVGVYIFSQAITVKEAEEEADYVLKILNAHPDWDITMPVVFDAETTSGGRLANADLSKSAMTKIAQAFCKKIEAAGYTPMIYGGIHMFGSGMDATTLAKSYKLWFARYNNTTTSNRSSGTAYSDVSYGYDFWQYSSTAKVSGYSGNLDISFWYKGSGTFSTPSTDTTAKTVSSLKATASGSDTVSLSWSATGTVSGYRVYRYNSSQNAYTYLGETTKKSYTDTGLSAGCEYKYKVCSYWNENGTDVCSAYSDEASVITKPGDVNNVRVSASTQTELTIAWDSVSGATGYRLYKYNESTEKYVNVIDVSSSVTSYTFTGISAGSVNDYKVKAYVIVNGTYAWGTASEECVYVTNPSVVAELKATYKSATAVALKWSSVSGATGYQIYRLNSSTGKYEKLKTVTGESAVSYTDTAVSSGTTYSYQVRAYIKYDGVNYFGEFSSISSMTTAPAKVGSLKLTAASKAVTLKWSKVTGATGYEIYRYNSTTKKYEKVKTIKGVSTITWKNTKLTKGTTYKYKVRAYRSYEGTTYYGKFSAATKIKAK